MKALVRVRTEVMGSVSSGINEVDASVVSIVGYKFLLHKTLPYLGKTEAPRNEWTITEPQSGYAVIWGYGKKEVVEQARLRLKHAGEGNVKRGLAKMIETRNIFVSARGVLQTIDSKNHIVQEGKQ